MIVFLYVDLFQRYIISFITKPWPHTCLLAFMAPTIWVGLGDDSIKWLGHDRHYLIWKHTHAILHEGSPYFCQLFWLPCGECRHTVSVVDSSDMEWYVIIRYNSYMWYWKFADKLSQLVSNTKKTYCNASWNKQHIPYICIQVTLCANQSPHGSQDTW